MNDNIVKCLPEKFGELAALWERSVAATHGFLSPDDFGRLKNEVPRYFPQMGHIYIYRDADGICGFIAVADGKIEMLFADPCHIGRGVGSALFDFAVRELGARRVDVNEQNEGGLTFYLRKGCTVLSRSEHDPDGRPYPILHLAIGTAG